MEAYPHAPVDSRKHSRADMPSVGGGTEYGQGEKEIGTRRVGVYISGPGGSRIVSTTYTESKPLLGLITPHRAMQSSTSDNCWQKSELPWDNPSTYGASR